MWRLRSLVYYLLASATCRILTSTQQCPWPSLWLMMLGIITTLRQLFSWQRCRRFVVICRGLCRSSRPTFLPYLWTRTVPKSLIALPKWINLFDRSQFIHGSTRLPHGFAQFTCGHSGHTSPRCQFKRYLLPYGSRGGIRPFPYQRPASGRPSSYLSLLLSLFALSLMLSLSLTTDHNFPCKFFVCMSGVNIYHPPSSPLLFPCSWMTVLKGKSNFLSDYWHQSCHPLSHLSYKLIPVLLFSLSFVASF